MKLSFAGERVLAVVAHPDDAELLCAGTLSRAQDDGAAIAICVICQGDKGQPDPPIADLAERRREELTEAAGLIHAQVFPGWVPDSSLFDSVEQRHALIEIMRQFRPTLVLSHDEADYHSDHQAAARLTETCTWLATSRGFTTASPVLDRPPELWAMDTVGMQRFVPGFAIDISTKMPLKEKMLLCHQTQLQRSGDTTFAPLMDLMKLQAGTRGMQSGCAAAEVFHRKDLFKRTRAW